MFALVGEYFDLRQEEIDAALDAGAAGYAEEHVRRGGELADAASTLALVVRAIERHVVRHCWSRR